MSEFVTFDLQRLVSESRLPRGIKSLLTQMIIHADGRTAVGRSGQEKLGEYAGYSDRHVRNLLAQLGALVAAGESPVRVVIQRRGLPGGKGSDTSLYRVERVPEAEKSSGSGVAQQEKSSGSATPKRKRVPVQVKHEQPQPEIRVTSTGNLTQPQPEAVSDDHPRDQPSDQPSLFPPSKPTEATEAKPEVAKRQKSEAERDQPPVTGTHELKLHYVAEFERLRHDTPEFGKQWSRGMKALGELVTTHGLEKAKAIVTRGISDTYRNPAPWRIAQDSVMYQGEASTLANAPKKAVERQQGDNPDLVVNGSKWSNKARAEVVPLPLARAAR